MSHISHQNSEFFHSSRERSGESSNHVVVQVWLVDSTRAESSVEVVLVDQLGDGSGSSGWWVGRRRI